MVINTQTIPFSEKHEKHVHLSINYNKLKMSLTYHLFSSRHCQHSQLHYNDDTVSHKTQQFTSANNSCHISESILKIRSGAIH